MKHKYFIFLLFMPINTLADLVAINPNYSSEDRIKQLVEELNSDSDSTNYQDVPIDTKITINLKNPSNDYLYKKRKSSVEHENLKSKKKEKVKKSIDLKPNTDLAVKKQLIGINRFEK